MESATTRLAGDDLQDRRSFFLAAIYGIGAVIGAALGIPAAIYLLLPPRARSESQWFEAGDAGGLSSGEPQELVFRRNRVDGWKITSEKSTAWVVKASDGRITAFSPWCTHLGCAYHWDDRKQQFLCPCHGSAFGPDGKVLAGPAPRPLDRYEVKVEGGKLWLGPLAKREGTRT